MAICIAGESGTGKTSSLRKLPPKTSMIVDSDKKGLPWKDWRKDFNAENKKC